MPSRRILIALAAIAAAVLIIVAVINPPANNDRGDGFKSEAAAGVATGGAADKKTP
jgi:hypothetical protein